MKICNDCIHKAVCSDISVDGITLNDGSFKKGFAVAKGFKSCKHYAPDNESDCTGCRWHKEKRYQRCNCCRRNKSLKDGYEKEATQ